MASVESGAGNYGTVGKMLRATKNAQPVTGYAFIQEMILQDYRLVTA
jgi:hypothetical protein